MNRFRKFATIGLLGTSLFTCPWGTAHAITPPLSYADTFAYNVQLISEPVGYDVVGYLSFGPGVNEAPGGVTPPNIPSRDQGCAVQGTLSNYPATQPPTGSSVLTLWMVKSLAGGPNLPNGTCPDYYNYGIAYPIKITLTGNANIVLPNASDGTSFAEFQTTIALPWDNDATLFGVGQAFMPTSSFVLQGSGLLITVYPS